MQAGIGGGGESIVQSGRYVDDIDDGDIIVYTGQGGRDLNTGRQIKNQECGQPLQEDLDVSELRDPGEAGRQALEDRLDTSDRMGLADPLAIEEIVFGQGCLPLSTYAAILP